MTESHKNRPMEVVCTDEFAHWYRQLAPGEQDDLVVVVQLLESSGVLLGYPHSSALKGSRHSLRELRPKQGHSPLRVAYAFDPRRDAVLLIGGDKRAESNLYPNLIRKAEAIWEAYLAEQAAGIHDKE